RDFGFSERMIDTFFRPFMGGILLDRGLSAPSRLFRFYFRMMADGATSVPALGMEEIPRQLAGRLPDGTIRTDAPVARVGKGEVELESGEVLSARAVVVATEGPVAARLLRGKLANPGSRGTTTLWFAIPEPLDGDPVLILNGEGKGPVNHMAFMDRVSEKYAPEGRGLAALNVLDDALPEEIRIHPGTDPTAALLPAVGAQMKEWFGSSARKWQHLRTYRIDHAHPLQTPRSFDPPVRSSRLGRDLWVAGDHRENASLNGAMGSGRRAARQLAEELAGG
ncbi:MAG: amine oxidase, partial [Gemmatimonadales bacterium]